MRNCDECQICCNGYVSGTARGSWFGNLKSCKYLDNACTIYNDRPITCRNYYCAWAQELFPEWMRPDKINVLISVELDKNNQKFLKVVTTDQLEDSILNQINNFVKINKTYFKIVKLIPIEKI